MELGLVIWITPCLAETSEPSFLPRTFPAIISARSLPFWVALLHQVDFYLANLETKTQAHSTLAYTLTIEIIQLPGHDLEFLDLRTVYPKTAGSSNIINLISPVPFFIQLFGLTEGKMIIPPTLLPPPKYLQIRFRTLSSEVSAFS